MIIVTSNRGKYAEYSEILSRAGVKLELMLMSYPEEQLDMLEEVAEKSANYLRGILKTDFFIDDSGIFIEELKGFPGVYSSYANRTIGNRGILRLMENAKDRNAEFSTCIAYYDGNMNLFVGKTRGTISTEERGRNGFGFDPIFIPEGHEETYAEMSLEMKDSLSHRSKAANSFLEYLKKKEI
jgi:XTP/dITP diphosphohydrolase